MSTSGTVTFHVESTPFAADPEGADAFYAALGKIMFLWGRLENHFDSNLLIIRKLPDAGILDEPRPISWKRRAKLWRKAFGTLACLAAGREAALALMTEIMETAPDRHTVTHSIWNGFVSTDPLTAKALSIREKGAMIQFREHLISIDDLRNMQLEADRLNTRLVPISLWLGSLQRPTAPYRS